MKIAILLSGRINVDKYQYNNFYETFLKNNEVDIFVSYPYKYKPIVQEFIELYKPKAITESDENYIDVSKYKLHFENNRHNVMCMILNRKKVLEIFKEFIQTNNTNYDIIISTRCDLLFSEPINFNLFSNNIKNNIICAANTPNNIGGVDDRIAFCNYYTIEKYLNLYDNIITLLDSGIIIHPEMLTMKNLDHQNINIIRYQFNFDINRNLITF